MGRIDDKVAVILGAAGQGNMGQTIARRFAAEGAHVVVTGRAEVPLRALARDVGGIHAVCDITRRSDVAALVKTIHQHYGRVDIAVNTTGWAPMTKLLEVEEEELDRLNALQFKGVYFFLQSMVAEMAADGGGSIIQVSSASAYALLYNHAAYIATKSAGDALVRCFANEFGQRRSR